MGKSTESEKSPAPQFLTDALLPEEKSPFGNQEEKSLLKERVKQLHTKASSILNQYGKRESSRKSTGVSMTDIKTRERIYSFKKITILRTPPTEVRKGNKSTELYLYAEIQNRKLPEIVIKTGLQPIALHEEDGFTRGIATIQKDGNFFIDPFAGESYKERVDFIEKTLEFIEKDLKSKK